MLIVPYKSLSRSALYGVLDDFITREGTDYGPHGGLSEASLPEKRERLLEQLERGQVVITFDPVLASTTLVFAA